jgi:hypothetical protein
MTVTELGRPDRANRLRLRAFERIDRFRLALLLMAAAGLVARVAYVVLMRDRGIPGDGRHYHWASLYLVDGLGFISPITRALTGEHIQDAIHPPGWTVVLAGSSAIGLRSYLSHQLVACTIGTVTIVMTGLAGRAAFSRRTGLFAAALAAGYPNIWVYERELLSEPLAMLGVSTAIWLAYRFRAGLGPARALVLGATVGLLALTRSELITIALFLVVPLIWSAGGEGLRRISRLAIAGAACATVIAPWAIYNSTRLERPVPLSAGLGGAMRGGNCERTYYGDRLGYYELGCVTFAAVDSEQSIADAQYRRAALEYMGDNPARVPVVMAARVGRTFGFFRPLQQIRLEAVERGTPVWVIRLGFIAYWTLLPLAVAGALFARRRRIPLYPMLAFPATVLVSVLLTTGSVRYRASAEIPVVILAALALDVATDALRRRRASTHFALQPPGL